MLYESFLLLGVLSVAFVLPYLLIGMIWKAAVPGPLLWLHVFIVCWRISAGSGNAAGKPSHADVENQAGVRRRQAVNDPAGFPALSLAWPSLLAGVSGSLGLG
jgi:hypothetical protein